MTEIQTSKYTLIKDGTSNTVDNVSLRTNWATGLQTTRKYDEFGEGKQNDYENLMVSGAVYNY